jgi:DNA ligase D-like protein (predicted ligase)/DNA ligase D-like protein (predicted polymerase)/DNA ligase D-like protein (predicted 3'-phosphoesterase)
MAAPFTLTLPSALAVRHDAAKTWVADVDGREVRLSNLDKVYWPADGYTKGDLIQAYYNLAPYILPHLRDRPLTLRRMPDGIDGPEFYQKEAPSPRPEWVPTTFFESHGTSVGGTRFLLAQEAASLLWIANLGCIEFHPWHSRWQTIDRPDYAFFDLDPFPPITFDTVRRTALLVRVALERLQLPAYVRTSGATGLQVYVPLDGSHTFDEARGFVERVCRIIHRTWPEGTTMEWEIAKRSGKVFLDYGMVAEGRNIAAVYSVRPVPGACVATPLTWDEVEGDVEPGDFTIANVWERYARLGDLWAPMLDGGTSRGVNLYEAMDALGMPFERRARVDVERETPEPVRAAASRGNRGTPRKKSPRASTEAKRRTTSATRKIAAGSTGLERDTASEPLAEYKRKRRFDVTTEPEGAVLQTGERLMFMIHKHHARRLHYDLRLERNGVLASWAVPRGLPFGHDDRRLAVHVEDHPMEYGSFEGSIPKGEYGAGDVRIFDHGWYEAPEWEDDKITLVLHGERLAGEYHLVHTRDKDWLIFRSKRSPVLEWTAPPAVEPMLATAVDDPFDDDRWTFEVKWDGVRTLAAVSMGAPDPSVRLFSRRVRDVTAQYPEVAADLAVRLAAVNGLVDGEIVALDAQGRPSFERLQNRSATPVPGASLLASTPVEYVAFDLLWLDGSSLMDRPLEERYALLSRLLVPAPHVQIAQRIDGIGTAFFEQARALGLEGVIAKKIGSVYRPGRRTRDWLKIKAVRRQDCVICGWLPGEGSRGGMIGSLALGVMRDGGLSYAGNVGTGFTEERLRMLLDLLTPLEAPAAPFELPRPTPPELRHAHWVRPEVVCEVEYLEFTSQGRMRAPSFKGLRQDKVPEDAVLEA